MSNVESILICDKDQMMSIALKKLLIKSVKNIQVNLFPPIDSLVDYCQQNPPQILFLEARKDLSLLSSIREKFPYIDIYVMTYINDFDFLTELMNLGIKSYFLKPVSIEKIVKTLQNQKTRTNPLIEKLHSYVLSKNFQQFYQDIDGISESLHLEYLKNPTKAKKELFELIEESLFLMNCVTTEQKDHLLKRFTFHHDWFLEKYRIQFFVFALMDEVFRQQTLQKTQQLSLFYEYIDKHILDNISLSDVAMACNFSQGYLSRVIKDRYQIGFNTYIQYRKLQIAKQKFYFNEEKIIDVSFHLSYNESSYFCKVFKKIEGMTPFQLKKQMELDKLALRSRKEG